MPLSPEERTLRARYAALTRSAHTDPQEMTAPMRAAFRQQFIEQARADAPPGTSEAEVLRRAEVLRKLHYTKLGMASAKARTKKGRAALVSAPAPETPITTNTGTVVEIDSTPGSEQ